MESIGTVIDLFSRAEFLTGLVLGAVVLAIFALFPGDNSTGWAIGMTIPTVVGIFALAGVSGRLTLGLAALATGGWILMSKWGAAPSTASSYQVVAWLAIAFGALIVTNIGGLSVAMVVRIASPLFIAGAGYLLSHWGRQSNGALLGPLWAVTAFGVWVTVPDTELARLLLGVSIPLALATTMWGRYRKVGLPGAFVLVGLLTWITLLGGEAREASIIGAWGAIGILPMVPLLGPVADKLPGWTLILAHVVVVAISTRVIGLWVDPYLALLGTSVLASIAYLGLRSASSQFASTMNSSTPQSDT